MRAGAALLLLAGASLGAHQPYESGTRPAGSQEVSQLQEYTRTLSKQWINQILDIDIDAIGFRLKRRARAYTEVNLTRASPNGEAVEVQAQEPVFRALSLRLEQYDDFLRMTRDLQDIPFALTLDAEGRLFGGMPMTTRIFVPLSWKDELRAEATIPLPNLDLPLFHSLMMAAGLNSRWALKSAYTNRLGLSSVQTGLGTQWLQLWNLEYSYRVRFGQGVDEASHWLKLERGF